MFAFERTEDGHVYDPVIDAHVTRSDAAARHLCDGALAEHNARVAHYAQQEPVYEELSEKLLERGGLAVLLKREPKLEMLLEQGSFYTGSVEQLNRDELTHHAVEALYKDDAIDEIGIGWALRADNGVWTRHAWGCRNNSIIEATATERSAYFGVTYNDIEIEGDGLFRLNTEPAPLQKD